MSPEQISGGQVGFPSDVFQLGLVLYEMLSGRYAFCDESGGIPSPKDPPLPAAVSWHAAPALGGGRRLPRGRAAARAGAREGAEGLFPDDGLLRRGDWNVLVDLREEEASRGIAMDSQEPGLIGGKAARPRRRGRVYAPMQTPPSGSARRPSRARAYAGAPIWFAPTRRRQGVSAPPPFRGPLGVAPPPSAWTHPSRRGCERSGPRSPPPHRDRAGRLAELFGCRQRAPSAPRELPRLSHRAGGRGCCAAEAHDEEAPASACAPEPLARRVRAWLSELVGRRRPPGSAG